MDVRVYSTDKQDYGTGIFDIVDYYISGTGNAQAEVWIEVHVDDHTYSINQNRVTLRLHITTKYRSGTFPSSSRYVNASISVGGSSIWSDTLDLNNTYNTTITHTINCNVDGSVSNFVVGGTLGSNTGNGTFYFNKIANTKVKINNVWKNAFSWIKTNAGWKRCIMWKKINGVWKKGK